MKNQTVKIFAIVFTVAPLLGAPGLPPVDADTGEGLSAPLFDGLGHHHHAITTKSARAQRYFDQGLTLCYGFNHTEAIRSFRARWRTIRSARWPIGASRMPTGRT